MSNTNKEIPGADPNDLVERMRREAPPWVPPALSPQDVYHFEKEEWEKIAAAAKKRGKGRH